MDAVRLETMSMRGIDPTQKERQRAEKIAGQFETLFVRSLVSSLRQTGSVGGGAGMFGEGPGAGTYSDWFDDNLAEKVAASGHLGIKDQLMRDFERHGEIPRLAADVDRAHQKLRAAAAQRASLSQAMTRSTIDVLP